MIEYIGILFTFLASILLAAFLLTVPKLLSPKVHTDIKSQPFECGKTPFDLPKGNMPVHFYIVAMLFIVFDIELVFLFPWAVNFRHLGLFGVVEMAIFMSFVVLGLWYVFKKRALEWN